MESVMSYPTTSAPKNRRTILSTQVLQVHKKAFVAEDDYNYEGIYVCHVPLAQILKDASICNSQIDAVIVDPECSVSDIVSIREISRRSALPLILHSFKFHLNEKETALESGVDEYHVGPFDQQFIKRTKLLKKAKLQLNADQGKQLSHKSSSFKFWLEKRSFDIAISVLIILSLLPILLIILPLVTLEPKGSILSSTKRVGKNYRVFNLYKFNCFSSRSDEKLTGIIKLFLRKLHLVGLPQILNVLVGDMSLVGNYPVLEQDAEKLTKDEVAWRFSAPVGIIGLWRFNHRDGNKTDACDFTEPDIQYAMTSTLWLDLRILFCHFQNLILGERKVKEQIHLPYAIEKLTSGYTSKDHILNVAPN
jgi:lipopolysaccharide/colanic/teichoic acid biosynthesis glycosyltransferase